MNHRSISRWRRAAILLAACLSLGGCVSPMVLDGLSLGYNQATADDISKQLLLNVARAKFNEPIHFTAISNIAATLNFEANIGVTPPLTGDLGTTIMPIAGVNASDNPTITIVPIQGEEFTLRLLTPLTEDKLTLLLRQNVDVDMLLRLVTLEFRTRVNGREVVYHNRPRDRDDYAQFRKIVLHLSSIQDRDELYIEPLEFVKHWTLPADKMDAASVQAMEKEYDIGFNEKKQVYHLGRPVSGRIIITNYDPDQLPEAERIRLNAEAEQNAPNDLLVDIRAAHPGGEFPLHGRLRLRSFANIVNFVGRTLSLEPEHDVAKDPRTPHISQNPIFAMEMYESDDKPEHTDLAVKYHGKYFAVGEDHGYPWNQTAFRVLWQIFQMTISDLPRAGTPSITIAK
jgi:hypothetical protein